MLDRSFTSPINVAGRSKSRFTPERMAAASAVRSPKAVPGSDYQIGNEAVLHPIDPASYAGVPDTFAHRYRAAQPIYRGPLAVLTRGAVVEALSPDMDGRFKGGPGVTAALTTLTAGELPEHLRGKYPFIPDGLDAFAPLADEEAEAFMGSALYRIRNAFPLVRFVSGDDLNKLRDGYAAEQAELAERAAMRAQIKKGKAERDARNR